MHNQGPGVHRFLDPFLLILLGVSLAFNVYLYRLNGDASAAPVLSVQSGDILPPLLGKNLLGQPSTVTFGERPVLLYVFSPNCIWCDKNLNNVKHLDRSIAGRYDFVGVALESDGVDAYLAAHQLKWRVVTDIEAKLRQRYRLGVTPQTIVMGMGGRVLHAWTGAYTATVADQIERIFGLTLPGVDKSGDE